MKYPFIKQKDIKECGPISLLMIIKHYGGNMAINDLKEMTKTDKNGTTAFDIIESAKKIGFDAYGIKQNLHDKEKIILPCIAHVIKDDKYLHYVVIYKIDYNKKRLLVADSSNKILWWTFDYFEKISTQVFIVLKPLKQIINYEQTSIIDLLLEFISKNKKVILYIFLMTFISTIMMIVSSYIVQIFMSLLNQNNYESKILILLIIFANVYLIKSLAEYYRMRVMIYLNKKIDYEMVANTFKNIINLPYTYFYNHTTGEIVSKINDLDIIKRFIVKIILTVVLDILFSLLTIIVLFFISKELLLITIINIIMYILMAFLFGKLLHQKIINMYQSKVEYSSYLVEALANYELIKGLAIKDMVINNFKDKQINMLNENEKIEKIYAKQMLYRELMSNLFFLITISLGFYLIVNGKLTIGLLITYNALYLNFITPLKDLLELNIIIKESKTVLSRIETFNKKDNQKYISHNLNGDVYMKNVSYEYKDKNILKDISLEIPLGSKILITGDSGQGKSTLIKLIAKYYKTNGLSINNVDYHLISNDQISSLIGYTSQQERLFNDTIFNNIVLDSNFNKDIIDIFEINKVIENKNLGYNYLIEELGNNLSGGERQRIILARTFLNDRKIYLLDETFNELDVKSEEGILKNLFNYFKDKTIIIISHRTNNKHLFDRVLCLEGGLIYDV
jgi:ATP-binding cassette, subfamily C, bacteriocin exporter